MQMSCHALVSLGCQRMNFQLDLDLKKRTNTQPDEIQMSQPLCNVPVSNDLKVLLSYVTDTNMHANFYSSPNVLTP